MVAMHIPDGLLSLPTAIVMALASIAVIVYSMKRSERDLGDRRAPLAGLTAAFVFAAQMVNFPVASGTSGHLLGGALAAVLLGPYAASVVVAVVVTVQALVFADGGLTALGINVFNMAIVTTFGGWAAFVLLRRLFPSDRNGIVSATGLAAATSVVLSSMAFSLEWLFGATAPVPFDTVFGAMVGVHTLIGVGEGVISALTIAAVLAARPDLVYGAKGVDVATPGRRPVRWRTFAIGAALATVAVAAVGGQFASAAPDGLERVARDQGLGTATGSATAPSIFSNYAVAGIDHAGSSLAIAGLAGVAITALVTFGMLNARRAR